MRQFFSLRFWAAIGMLVGLWLVLYAMVGQRDSAAFVPEAARPVSRRLDVVQVAIGFEDPAAFGLDDGRVVGEATLVLVDGRRLLLAEGTPGASTCDALDQLVGCVFAADLLGDAVVWFSLLPADLADGGEYPLPPMVALLDGVTWARLENGWEVPLLPVVSRRCATETASLGDFLERIGSEHVTVFDLDAGEVSAVRCIDTD